MKEETSEQSCLTLEQLEELYSGSGTPEERQHLDQCASCQAKLQEMKRLDAMVATAIQPPDGLSDRILAAVQRDKPGMIQGRLKLFRRLTYTAAAAILIVLGLSIWTYGPVEEGSEQVVAEAVQPAYEPLFTGKYVRSTHIGAPAPDNANVKTVGSAAAKPYTTSPASGMVFPSVVEQVWSMPDVEKGVEFLKQVAAVNQRQFDMRENESFHEFAIALKDTEAQELADKLASYGWNLLSPSLPQPNSTENVMFTENPVIYKLKLVRAEK
jgi:hypothetical protein